MPLIRRIGRPGLIGLAARTAVVAGTATAVSGGMIAHRQQKAQTQYEAAQFEAAQQQAAMPAPVPASAQAAPVDLVTELQKLGELKAQGVLSDAEFDAAKARLLS